jgi:hypothetical protein
MEDYNKCHNLYKILKNEIEGLSSRDQQKSD